MDRTQFTCYESFYKAAKRMKKKADQADFWGAVCEYALYGNEPDLDKFSDAVAGSLELVIPIITASRRKAQSGKLGGATKKSESKPQANGSKPQANGKQTEANRKQVQEKEQVQEKDKEQMLLPPTPYAAVLTAYMDKINPTPSDMCVAELSTFVDDMGSACCLRAIDIAVDSRKGSWGYVRAILRDKRDRGVKCIADWDALEQKREEVKRSENAGAGEPGYDPDEKWGIKYNAGD